ncbi:MAG: CoA-binding protein [Chloroflexi bacterium]|nr:CoA-binding protein [Chloroflexota bacterium]
MSHKPDFETMFNPRSVTVIGTSAKTTMSSNGTSFIKYYRELGFSGRIYPIHPTASQILDLPAYPNVGSLPEAADLAIVSVPARVVPQILEECADASIRNIQIFTAGFRETGESEGIVLEKEIERIAKERCLSVIGPNCLGLYVPKAGLAICGKLPKESGPVGFISQSGGMLNEVSRYCKGLGIRFSKAVSIGNATVLDSTDFLEYFADDPETQIIGMYLEGIGDGRKLTKLVGEINPRKPVVVLKGGLTESGARAVASHTGALAGSEAIWDAFFRQTGATRVDSQEELLDMLVAFRFMLPLRGRGLAVLSTGGGLSVSGADTCAREGLETPTLSEPVLRGLREFVPDVGFSIRNPLDVGLVMRNIPLLDRTLKLLGADPRIAGFLVCLMTGMGFYGDQDDPEEDRQYAKFVGEFGRDNAFHKPLAMVLRSPGDEVNEEIRRIRLHADLTNAGVAVFPSLSRAARALRKVVQYHEFLGSLHQ